jgi:hypothetical protein
MLLAERVAFVLAVIAWVSPFQQVPRCHDEIEGTEYIRGVSLNAPIVVIQLRAQIISRDKIEEASHAC